MEALGKLTKIDDLRSVWKHEAINFTRWLVKEENLELLSNTIGINIEFEDKESKVGDFSVDIYAKEANTDKNIIIENQLEDTNHDHLGKIITYASGKEASYIIWIVKNARDEHRNAIEWLNNHTDESIEFYLLEIELWKINDSLPAPKFNIVVKPNTWVKEIMNSNEELSDIRKLQISFWENFKEYALSDNDFIKLFSLRKAHAHYWYDISIGTSQCHISLTINIKKSNISAGIYINDNFDLYNKFHDNKYKLEEILGDKLNFNAGDKDGRLYIIKQIDVTNKHNWNECFSWLCDKSKSLYKIYNNIK